MIKLISGDVFGPVANVSLIYEFWGYLYKSGLFLHIFGEFRDVLDIFARRLCKNVSLV